MNTFASTQMPLYLALAGLLAGCGRREAPLDFHDRTLDPKVHVKDADTIVLAYPTTRRDVSGVFYIPRDAQDLPPVRVVEVEATLVVLQVLKGSTIPRELRFRHYDARGYPLLTGPPQGPCGHMGDRGIFFLRQQPGGGYRSAVDIYRPDIPTHWITESSKAVPCTNASDCIAKVPLGVHPGDDAGTFAACLRLGNALLSQPLVGYLATFQLLNDLVQEDNPRDVKLSACEELEKMYALEFPEQCRPLIAGTPVETEYLRYAVHNRESLKVGGVDWLQGRRQFQPKGNAEAVQDLVLISKSSDPETRKLAETLLKSLGAAP